MSTGSPVAHVASGGILGVAGRTIEVVENSWRVTLAEKRPLSESALACLRSGLRRSRLDGRAGHYDGGGGVSRESDPMLLAARLPRQRPPAVDVGRPGGSAVESGCPIKGTIPRTAVWLKCSPSARPEHSAFWVAVAFGTFIKYLPARRTQCCLPVGCRTSSMRRVDPPRHFQADADVRG